MAVARLFAALSVVACLPSCTRPPTPPTDLGVPWELAETRRATLSNIAYDVRLTVPEEREVPLRGTTTVSFDWNDPEARPVVLDFKDPGTRVDSVWANGEPAEWSVAHDHVVIEPGALRAGGRNEVRLVYAAGDEALNRSDDFLYTLFVPDRAHFSLPVFDQPNLKARFTLTLTVPEGWMAVANGATVAEPPAVSLPGRDASATLEDGGTWRFAATEPIPTYLFAFAAGRFRVEEAERGGRRLRMFHRETDSAKVARNRDAVFDLHAAALEWLEAYTGIPHPFPKFDFVLVPSFQYGGMEHPGAVFYRQDGVLLDESATQAELLGRASVISHETAHMWFGDLVTMNWFDDVWTKEVFANFMAAKIVRPSFPEVDHELRFLLAHHPAAYEVDRTAGANAIRQPLDNLREAGTLYGPIIYQKAPVVMRQLERRVGDEVFRDGLREYLRRFAYGNATWPDLIGILDASVPEDLAEWSRVWVEEPGRPTVFVELEKAEGRIRRLALRQEDPAGEGRLWPQRLDVALGYPDSVARAAVDLDASSVTLDGWTGRDAPDFVLPSASGTEYARFVLDERSLAWLTQRLPELDEPLLRGAAWVTLWDEVLDGRVDPARFLDLALAALRVEEVELVVQRVLGYSRATWWRLLAPEERAARAAEVEAALWRGAWASRAVTARSAFFSAWRDVVLTDEGIARLARLWSGAEPAPVPLSEADRTSMATELALREVPDAERVLDAQRDSVTNPDRRARFDFVRPSLSADPAVREAFFESLLDPANREREPWALAGLANLNHPLRQEHARRFVTPALEELEEVQRTGDIFFPGRWLDAVLGGHATPEAARDVRTFLDAHPDYPPRLKAKVLQSADGLFRAAEIHRSRAAPERTP